MTGMTDDEYNKTIYCIQSAAQKNSYSIDQLSKTEVAENRHIYEILIREKNENEYIDVKVAIAGSVDSGKSSFLGVLTTGKNDNGRGSARINVFNFPHEISTGRTSSIGHQIVGYNDNGENISYRNNKMVSWPEIVKNSSKIISFYDLAGHEKYLKTTIFGLASSTPDLCFIMVGANRGVLKMTKEHIFLCLTLQIPFCIVITKIDMVKNNDHIMKETSNSINKILKSPGVRKVPVKIRSTEDVINSAINLQSNTIVPIFNISNTTLEGINHINTFLHLAPKRPCEHDNNDVEMYIDLVWSIPSVGTVIGGHLKSGNIKIGDKLWFGPNNNEYTQIIVRSIHCKRVPIQKVKYGSYVCIGVRGITKQNYHKGNVVVSNKKQQILCEYITANIEVLKSHSTTIKVGYQPILHALTVRTSCVIEKIEKKISDRDNETDNDNILRTNDRATITLRLHMGKKYIKKNTNILLCEGRTKVVGYIIDTSP
jgi:GTPase